MNRDEMRKISIGIANEMSETDNAEFIATNGKSADARVNVYEINGFHVAATNGDPVWREQDEQAWQDLMQSEDIRALELRGLCLDCGKKPATRRQPHRAVWLCDECYAVDME